MKIKLSDIQVKSFVTTKQMTNLKGASGSPCLTRKCSLNGCDSFDYPGCGYVSIEGTQCATGIATCDGPAGQCENPI